MAEYKCVSAGTSDDGANVVNPGGVTTQETYNGAKLFNLYLAPKEQYSFMGRQTFIDHLFTQPFQTHRATFVRSRRRSRPEGSKT